LVVDPQNSGTVYVASDGVFKSSDGGGIWKPSSSGLGGAQVRAVALDPQNPGTVYAVTSLGLVKTTDGGATWNPLSDGFSKVQSFPQGCAGYCGPGALTSLVIDRRNPSTLYGGVGGNIGWNYQGGHVLKSTDAGISWSVVGDDSLNAANATLPQGGYFW